MRSLFQGDLVVVLPFSHARQAVGRLPNKGFAGLMRLLVQGEKSGGWLIQLQIVGAPGVLLAERTQGGVMVKICSWSISRLSRRRAQNLCCKVLIADSYLNGFRMPSPSSGV